MKTETTFKLVYLHREKNNLDNKYVAELPSLISLSDFSGCIL